MARNIFLLLILLVAQSAVAQKGKLKYKNAYEVVLNGTQHEAYQALRSFQEQNPKENLNVYFQLGKICQTWMRTYDALKQPDDVEYFSRHAKIYFGLCKGNMNKDEVDDNQSYYQGVELRSGKSNVQMEDILLDLDNRLADIENFRQNHALMLSNFEQMLDHYNSCIEQFMDINRANSNIKSLHMTANTEFLKTLGKLKNTYDSTIYYYTAYKSVIDAYAIGDYQQTASIKEIGTYRLNGLVASNFMEDIVPIWNFGKWVDDFNKKIANEIVPLKKEVLQTGNALNESISSLNNMKGTSDEWKAYKVPNTVRFKVGKYDYQSAVLDLLAYKESKAKLLEWVKKPQASSTTNFTFVQKSQYYQKLIEQKLLADSLLNLALTNVTDHTFTKYPDYLGGEFGSLAGLKSYLNQERQHNQKLLDNNIEGFKQILTAPLWDRQQKKDSTYYKRARTLIPTYTNASSLNWEKLFFNKFDTAQSDLYYTSYVSEKINSKYWISGYYKPFNKLPYAFIAKIHDQDSIQITERMLDFKHKDTVSQAAMLVYGYEKGALLLKSELHDTLTHQLIWIDSLGKTQKIDSIKIDALPKWLEYDDLNNLVFSAFRSKIDEYHYSEYEPLTFRLQSGNGTLLWQNSFNLKGELVDIVRFGNYWALVGNYSEIEDENGEHQFSESNQTAGFVALITEQGKLEKIHTFNSSTGVSLFKAIKTNSNTLNLVGLKDSGVPKSAVQNSRMPFFFALMNRDGTLIFSNKD